MHSYMQFSCCCEIFLSEKLCWTIWTYFVLFYSVEICLKCYPYNLFPKKSRFWSIKQTTYIKYESNIKKIYILKFLLPINENTLIEVSTLRHYYQCSTVVEEILTTEKNGIGQRIFYIRTLIKQNLSQWLWGKIIQHITITYQIP